MITGAHAIVFSPDADALRAFFRDVLEFDSVDAGGGWLIFALPPAEVAVHPADEGGRRELYLMCDDIRAAIGKLERKGVEISRPLSEESWGPVTAIRLPDGSELGLDEPRHPSPAHPGR
jgi:catechol 2,3-dioxygenase-like lactoylglutathione lyase family enzyme